MQMGFPFDHIKAGDEIGLVQTCSGGPALRSPRGRAMTPEMKTTLRCRCGRERDGPKKSCPACRATASESYRRRRDERIASGRCLKCGKVPPRAGRSHCEPCAIDAAAREDNRRGIKRAKGLCTTCRAPSGRFNQCRACRVRENEAKKAAMRERVAAGLCRVCGKPASPFAECDWHRARNRARRSAAREGASA